MVKIYSFDDSLVHDTDPKVDGFVIDFVRAEDYCKLERELNLLKQQEPIGYGFAEDIELMRENKMPHGMMTVRSKLSGGQPVFSHPISLKPAGWQVRWKTKSVWFNVNEHELESYRKCAAENIAEIREIYACKSTVNGNE